MREQVMIFNWDATAQPGGLFRLSERMHAAMAKVPEIFTVSIV
ncbi:hypothetical protein [Paraburkholderia bryophila]|nr:hypothetical protein [Paraburkholderia bryophila]